jgi:hypothetical protein
MKNKNQIIEKLKAAGYKNTGDNRSYAIRSLNSLIEIGMIDFKFVPADKYNDQERSLGFWFDCKDGKRRCTAYKVMLMGHWYYGHFIPKKRTRIMLGDRLSETCDNSSLSVNDILCRVARLISLKKEGVDFMKAEIFAAHGECSCSKCNGTGFLPCFAHYAEGVCFDCGGTGINRRILQSKIENAIKL